MWYIRYKNKTESWTKVFFRGNLQDMIYLDLCKSWWVVILFIFRLNKKVLDTTSPVLLRMFLSSIFISADIAIKQKQLYCDRLCDQGALYNGQVWHCFHSNQIFSI